MAEELINKGKLVRDSGSLQVPTTPTYTLTDATSTPKASRVSVPATDEIEIIIPEKTMNIIFSSANDTINIDLKLGTGLFRIFKGFSMGVTGLEGGTITLANATDDAETIDFFFGQGV